MHRTLLALSARLIDGTRLLTILGGICLWGILVVVTGGVVMRYAFNAPLLGINEIIQFVAVAMVMLSLPYCTANEYHVAVDVFENWLGRWGRFLGDILSRALAGIVLALLCRRAFLWALEALEYGDASNMLNIPVWPYYAILAVGAGLSVIVFVLQLLIILSRGATK